MPEVPGFDPEAIWEPQKVGEASEREVQEAGTVPPTDADMKKILEEYASDAKETSRVISQSSARKNLLSQAHDYDRFAQDLESGYEYEHAIMNGPRPGKHWRAEDARRFAVMLRTEAERYSEKVMPEEIQKEVDYYVGRYRGASADHFKVIRDELSKIADEFEQVALDVRQGKKYETAMRHRLMGEHWGAEEYAQLAGAIRTAAEKQYPS